MPSVNFRMTNEQRDTLAAEARENGRSIQKEIEWRVFHRPYDDRDMPPREPEPFPEPRVTVLRVDQSALREVSPLLVGGKRFTGPDPRPSEKKR